MKSAAVRNLVTLELQGSIWERVFTVAPLVLIGSRNENGEYNLAPKHMATQLGWDHFFGFVCTPRHTTYRNIRREKAFTVSYARPTQVVLAGLAASPRCEDDAKPGLRDLPTFPARKIAGAFVRDAYLFLECELDRIVDGFGENSLIAGKIVAAYAAQKALRGEERDDHEVVHRTPLLVYLEPGRFARVSNSFSFPFPADFKK